MKRTTGLRDLYIQSFAKVLRQSLFSLVGVHSEVSTDRAEGSYLDIPSGIAVIIGLTGCPMGRAIVYMDTDTMYGVARAILMKGDDEKLTAEEASDVIEEAANIIAGRCASSTTSRTSICGFRRRARLSARISASRISRLLRIISRRRRASGIFA